MSRLEFAGHVLHIAARKLLRAGVEVPLQPREFDLLCALAAAPGEVLGRERLFAEVWPDTVVSDAALTQAIAKLRKALGDESHQLIRTHARRGYSLQAEVRAGTATPLGKSGQELPSPEALTPPAPVEPGRASILKRIGAAPTLLGLLLLAALALLLMQRTPTESSRAPALDLLLQAQQPGLDEQWLGPTLLGLLRSDFAGQPGLRVLDGEQAGEAVADRLVGRYGLQLDAGRLLQIEWQLYRQGRPHAVWQQSLPMDRLGALSAELQLRLAEQLPHWRRGPPAPTGSLPEAAALLLAEGLQSRFEGRHLQAHAALQEAVRLAPQSALARTHLADVLTTLGQRDLAIAQAQRAAELAADAGAVSLGLARAQLAEAKRDFAGMAEEFGRLLVVHPEHLAWRARHALALTNSGQAEAALEVIAQVEPQRLSPYWQVVWLQLRGRALSALGRESGALEAAREAAALAERHGFAELEGQVRLLAAAYAYRQGQLQPALALAARSVELFDAVGNTFSGFNAAQYALGIRINQGQPVELTEVEALLERAQALGNRFFEGQAWMIRANFEASRGELAASVEAWVEARARLQEVGDRRTVQSTLIAEARYLRMLGRFAEAEARLDSLAASGPSLLPGNWEPPLERALLRAAQGDIEGALVHFAEPMIESTAGHGVWEQALHCERGQLLLRGARAREAEQAFALCAEVAARLDPEAGEQSAPIRLRVLAGQALAAALQGDAVELADLLQARRALLALAPGSRQPLARQRAEALVESTFILALLQPAALPALQVEALAEEPAIGSRPDLRAELALAACVADADFCLQARAARLPEHPQQGAWLDWLGAVDPATTAPDALAEWRGPGPRPRNP